MNYFLHLVVYLEIYIIVATSLNLLLGYAGLLQVAHAAYFGVGAYTAAILTSRLEWGFLPAVLAAGVVSAVLSLLVSVPSFRLRGDAFVMTSLAVQVGLFAIMHNWTALTGGPFGISSIPKPDVAGIRFATSGSVAALYGLITLGLGLILAVLKLSPFGRALQAMRDDWLAARSLGIATRKLKMEAFAVASAFVGIAGAMYGAYVTYIDPTTFSLDEGILMLSMVIIGGTGNVVGPIVGATLLITIPEMLRFMDISSASAASLRLLAYGLLLIIMMRWRPQGIAGRYRFQ